jgi:hypothetical protein
MIIRIIAKIKNSSIFFKCPNAGRAFTFFLDKKSKQKIKKKSSIAFAKLQRSKAGLYPQVPQARGHFFGPPRFALS